MVTSDVGTEGEMASGIAGIWRTKVCPAEYDEAPSEQPVPPADFFPVTWQSWN